MDEHEPNRLKDAMGIGETGDDVYRFMEAKGIPIECPACTKRDGWSVYWSEGGATGLGVFRDGSLVVGGGAVETLALRCHNCGFIRMFDLKAYKDWTDSNARQ